MSTKPKKFCFILMPFTDDFNDIYKLGIKQSCLDAGAYCERVDEQIFTESILERVYNQISKADIIIADMTGRNPNVFYEVGYAHALGKTTILLTKNADDIPFDLKHYPHIIYGDSISKLKDELTIRVTWAVTNTEVSATSQQKVEIDVYLDDKSLTTKNVEYITPQHRYPSPVLTLHNNTFNTFAPGDYRVGVITDQNYRSLRNNAGGKTIKLPDGNFLHMCPINEDILYPNSYTSFEITLNPKVRYKQNNRTEVEYIYEENQEITIRVFTPNGTRDFYLIIAYR